MVDRCFSLIFVHKINNKSLICVWRGESSGVGKEGREKRGREKEGREGGRSVIGVGRDGTDHRHTVATDVAPYWGQGRPVPLYSKSAPAPLRRPHKPTYAFICATDGIEGSAESANPGAATQSLHFPR